MTTSIPISRKVGPPKRKELKPRAHKYPFAALEVGDMFFLPDRTENNFASYAAIWSKRLKRAFRTRLGYCRLVKGVWTPCEETDDGAKLGIAVYRVAG